MNAALIIDFTIQTVELILMISMPAILVATVVGILVSLLQAITQIQEQTLSFAIKLIAVVVTILLTARWSGGMLIIFAKKIMEMIPRLVN